MKSLFVPRPLLETLLEIALDRLEPGGLVPVDVSRFNAAIREAGDVLDNATRTDSFGGADGCLNFTPEKKS